MEFVLLPTAAQPAHAADLLRFASQTADAPPLGGLVTDRENRFHGNSCRRRSYRNRYGTFSSG